MRLPKLTRLRAILVALLAHITPDEAAVAQSVGRMVLDDVTNAGRDFGAIWVTPLHGSRRDWLITGGVLLGAAAASPFDDNVDRYMVAHEDYGMLDAIGPFRRGGDFYSLNKATPYVAAAYVGALAFKQRGLRDGIFGCAAAYTANTVMRHQVIYRVIGRNRPDTLRDHPEGYVPTGAEQGAQYEFNIPADGYGQHSFPGGHVATMTTCTAFVTSRFELGVVEPVLWGLVGVMGVGRMADRGHWLSDQIVGVAFGYAVGREVALRQKRRLAKEKAKDEKKPAPTVIEAVRTGSVYIDADRYGTKLGWQQTF